MNKKVIVPALVLGAAVTVGALSYVGATSAAGNGFGNGEMSSNLAEKLGVEESQIDSAMQEMREERQALRQQGQDEKLSEAVENGVITSEQKDALVAHREEMRAEGTDRGAEMRASREERRAENETWMEENGIDHDALREYTGGGEGQGRLGGGMHGGMQK